MTKLVDADAFITHIEADKFIEGNILYAGGESLNSTKSTPSNNTVIKLLGEESVARIGGFLQFSSDYMLLSDEIMHCIKYFNRTSKAVGLIAGTCDGMQRKYADGAKLDARFTEPTQIIADRRDPLNVIIADTSNNAIRQLDTRNGSVTTIIKSDKLKFTTTMCWPPYSSAFLIVSTMTELLRVFTASKHIETLYSVRQGSFRDGRFQDGNVIGLKGLAFVHEHILIASDFLNNQLKVIDTINQQESYICCGYQKEHLKYDRMEGPVNMCNIIKPYGLAVVDHNLYIGNLQGIEKLPGKLMKFLCSVKHINILVIGVGISIRVRVGVGEIQE